MAGFRNLIAMRFNASPRPEKNVCHLQGLARTLVAVDALLFGQNHFRSVIRVRRAGVLMDRTTKKHLLSSFICGGVVVRASESQSVDLGLISLVDSYQKTLKWYLQLPCLALGI